MADWRRPLRSLTPRRGAIYGPRHVPAMTQLPSGGSRREEDAVEKTLIEGAVSFRRANCFLVRSFLQKHEIKEET
jgi:hypothetical protein